MAETSTANAAPAATPASVPAPQKKNNTALIVILVIVVILCLCCSIIGGVLYYVSRNAQNIAQSALDAAQQQAAKDLQNGSNGSNGSNGTNGSNGGSTGSTSTTLPSGFPSDVPIYSGSKVTLSSSDTKNGQTEYAATLSATGKASDITAFYKTNLPANGWTITGEQNFFGSSITAEKDTRQVSVVVLGDDKSAEQTYVVTVGAK